MASTPMIVLLMAMAVQTAGPAQGQGRVWASAPASDQCYAELAAGLNDPGIVSDPQVRLRLQAAGERLATLAAGEFRAIQILPHDREIDLVELKEMAARGGIKPVEVEHAAADWDRAMQGHRYLINQIVTRYPSCDFLGPLRASPDYQAIVSAAARVTERPG
ncbi:MAG: hypothetical protein EBR82_27545 [Caulobacteraceae bacterium]|nr:hypothetical protein [Caulobacteraceae bacterium]